MRNKETLIPGIVTSSRTETSDSDTLLTPRVSREGKPQDEATEGRLLQDTDGTSRYLGETSGSTFLDSVKEFMSTIFPLAFNRVEPSPGIAFLSTLGKYQTFDSRPLSIPQVDPLWLPSRTDMVVMLAGLRCLMKDGNGDFPSGGILYWGDMSQVPLEKPTEVLEYNRGLAFYHAAFAIAKFLQLTPSISKVQEQPDSLFLRRLKYFWVAP